MRQVVRDRAGGGPNCASASRTSSHWRHAVRSVPRSVGPGWRRCGPLSCAPYRVGGFGREAVRLGDRGPAQPSKVDKAVPSGPLPPQWSVAGPSRHAAAVTQPRAVPFTQGAIILLGDFNAAWAAFPPCVLGPRGGLRAGGPALHAPPARTGHAAPAPGEPADAARSAVCALDCLCARVSAGRFRWPARRVSVAVTVSCRPSPWPARRPAR